LLSGRLCQLHFQIGWEMDFRVAQTTPKPRAWQS
jgi:hypothetical protein